MLRCISKITITPTLGKPIELDFINEVEVVTSYDKMTDTAKVMFPRNINYEGKNVFVGKDALFKRKDKIKIELGYDTKLRTVFEGYITKVGASNPIVIECEDEMFILKNTNITYPEKTGTITVGKSGKPLKKPIITSDPITLNQLLDYMIPSDITYKIIVNNSTGTSIVSDVNLGNFRATKVSVTEILDTLKKEYGLYSYFQNGVLYVGLPYNSAKSNTEEFAFEKTIINGEDLDYQQADDLNLKVVAISMDSNNTKKQIEVGDTDGSQRTYYTYNASDDDLKIFANSKLKEIKYTGYSGKILTFGEPFVKHGDIAKITSLKFPEQDGYYAIVGVNYSMSVGGGYKQTIDVGRFIGSAISDVNTFKLTAN
jgi:hypothetical protein